MESTITLSRPTDTMDTPLPYTASPWKLILSDLRLALQNCLYIPLMFCPFRDSNGPVDELCPTFPNIVVIAVHVFLVVCQIAFLTSLPFLLSLPMPSFAFLGCVLLAYQVNEIFCRYTLNTGEQTVKSTHPLVPRKAHSHERWVFLNGIAVGTHWMQNSVNRLSQIFARPVTGIHSPTSGIVFDLIKCLIQRNFCYATQDVRDAYAKIKEILWDDDCKKLILIVHSQGGLAASLIVDWLVGEVSQKHLAKLEIYTFGNAANHFNDPRRLFPGEDGRVDRPTMENQGPSVGQFMPDPLQPAPDVPGTVAARIRAGTFTGIAPVERIPVLAAELNQGTWRCNPLIEHYANSDDFVCRWGVIHFINITNRYLGHLFQRNNSHGHLFVQHYLDPMFPLDRLGAVDEGSTFFNSIKVGQDAYVDDMVVPRIDQDWHLSRLWRYRGGRSPVDDYRPLEI